MPPPETMFALLSFAFVTSITPGPNNIMLTASGVNFGFTRSIPHMLGIGGGFMVLLLAVGAGLGAIVMVVPVLHLAIKAAGALYMLWLAWKVANTGGISQGERSSSRPMTFVEAALFQWVNPKAWVLAVSAMAIFVRPDHVVGDVLLVTVIFGLVTIPSVGTWAGFGHLLREWLRDPAKVRIFNVAMAMLLVASIVPMVA